MTPLTPLPAQATPKKKPKRPAKTCPRCTKEYHPTGPNQKHCRGCARRRDLESHRQRWQDTYVKKERDQSGSKNPGWQGGKSPAYYRKLCFETHGKSCFKCGNPADLVHHIDENRSNNDAKNLQPLCKRCHQIEHNCAANLPKKVEFKDRMCALCKALYKPTGARGQTCSPCLAK